MADVINIFCYEFTGDISGFRFDWRQYEVAARLGSTSLVGHCGAHGLVQAFFGVLDSVDLTLEKGTSLSRKTETTGYRSFWAMFVL